MRGRWTYRCWAYLLLGGAMLTPYLLLALVGIPIAVAALVGSTFLPPVRVVEAAALKKLLGSPTIFNTSRNRFKWSAMVLLHVTAGGVWSLLTLGMPVLVAVTIAAELTGAVDIGLAEPIRARGFWPYIGLAVGLMMLAYTVWVMGNVLRCTADTLLGPTAAERLNQLGRQVERLTERNRLARELHDSLGHSLSVVTMLSAAARRTHDPQFTNEALEAIETSGRAALDELDHVLGLLRDDAPAMPPSKDFTHLPALLSSTRMAGLTVDMTVNGDVASVPPLVSRESYRIVQESLTNVLRHASGPVAIQVNVDEQHLTLSITNPLIGTPSEERGRGLRGMTERVEVLRGLLSAGACDNRWEVRAELPW